MKKYIQLLERWFQKKQKVQARKRKIFCKKRQVWLCDLGINIGHEQNGNETMFLRPVVVINTLDRDLILVAPLTTKKKYNKHVSKLFLLKKGNYCLLHHIRSIDKKRLIRRVGQVSEEQFKDILKKTEEVIKTSPSEPHKGGKRESEEKLPQI